MPCGVGDYSASLAGGLTAQPGHHEVALLTSRAASPPGGHDIRLFNAMKEWSLREIGTVHSVLREWKPDIVHLQYPSQGFAALTLPALIPFLAWRAGAMPVRTWHEAFSGRRSIPFLLQSAAPGPAIVVRPNFADLMWPPLRRLLRFRRPRFIAGASSIARSTLSPAEHVELRTRYLAGRHRMIVFFGFIYPSKGVEQLFQIADPMRDTLIIAGNTEVDPVYVGQIRQLCETQPWAGHANLVGYLSADQIADLLAVADAVVLPFRNGGGSWNSSISAALAQGTPVVTTVHEDHGHDVVRGIYFARPDDLDDLRHGLATVCAPRAANSSVALVEKEWDRIAQAHLAVYGDALANRSRGDQA